MEQQRDIDLIIASIRASLPTLEVRQVYVSHPGTDHDGLWYFSREEGEYELQIESYTNSGSCPFLIESENGSVVVETVEDAIRTVRQWMHLEGS